MSYLTKIRIVYTLMELFLCGGSACFAMAISEKMWVRSVLILIPAGFVAFGLTMIWTN